MILKATNRVWRLDFNCCARQDGVRVDMEDGVAERERERELMGEKGLPYSNEVR